MSIQIRDFSGGMNLLDNESNILTNQYALAYNVRNRYKLLEAVKLPVEDTTLAVGKKQGICAFDNYILAFVDGLAYYKNIVTDGAWTKINDFAMTPTVDYLYTQAVPKSTMNFDRLLISENQIEGNSSNPSVNVKIIETTGNEGGLVVQDGLTQGWLISSNGSARKLQTYDEWVQYSPIGAATLKREYVPVMTKMAYINGILFGVAGDGRTIYRSVSGRPLDFVINVTTTGNKGGNADTTSYNVGYDTINCLSALSNGELIVGSENTCRFIEFDYNNTLFAEPKFLNRKSIPVGVVNQFSFLRIVKPDGNSYYYFVDKDGLRTFSTDSISDENENRNIEFSANLRSRLAAKQTVCASIVFDNYSIFSIKTTESNDNILAIYDNLRQQWVSFDNYSIGTIKQFAVASQGTNPTLYAITDTKLYRLFSGSYAQASVRFGSITGDTLQSQLKLRDIRAVFVDGDVTNSVVEALDFPNGESHKIIKENIRGLKTENILFNFRHTGVQSFRIQPQLKWQCASKLYALEVEVEGKTQETAVQQEAKRYAGT